MADKDNVLFTYHMQLIFHYIFLFTLQKQHLIQINWANKYSLVLRSCQTKSPSNFFRFQGLLATREQLCPAGGERWGDPPGPAQRQSHPLGVPLPGDREPPPRPKRQLRHTKPGQKPSPGLHTLTHQLSSVGFFTTDWVLETGAIRTHCILAFFVFLE